MSEIGTQWHIEDITPVIDVVISVTESAVMNEIEESNITRKGRNWGAISGKKFNEQRKVPKLKQHEHLQKGADHSINSEKNGSFTEGTCYPRQRNRRKSKREKFRRNTVLNSIDGFREMARLGADCEG